VTGLYDATGNLLTSYTYDPFGTTTVTSSTGVTEHFTFQGQYQDSAGVLHMGQRYYDPISATWLQTDPVDQTTNPAETNAYGFAAQDPINLSDPLGTSVASCIAKCTAASAAIVAPCVALTASCAKHGGSVCNDV
jgi:RHS repeat-associated protein